MPKTKKVDEAAVLSERMLEVLEARRTFGGHAYPPTLRHLGELCDGAPSHDLIIKAATKKAFKARASVIEKVDKQPSLDSPVYFKEDVPDPVELLARRMLAVLESQRSLVGAAYPPTLRRLAELCEVKASDTRVPKAASHAINAASHAIMADRTIIVAKAGKKPHLDAPVILKEDIQKGLSTIMPALLMFALSPVTSKSKGNTIETAAFSPADSKKRFIGDLQEIFEQALEEGIVRQDLPPDVAWVLVKGKSMLFLVENARPGVPQRITSVEGRMVSPSEVLGTILPNAARPAPDRDFARSFFDAFERLDRLNRSTNFVKLADLRRALSEFTHEEFDAGLRQLRIDGSFSLDSHEGLHGSLTHEERESGVRQAGSLLVYASRR